MKKVLAVIAAAILFGGVAGGTILGITHAAGLDRSLQASAYETEAQSEAPQGKGDIISESEASAVTKAGAGIAETTALKETKENGRTESAKKYRAVLDVSDIVEDAMPELVSITNTMVIRQQGYGNMFEYFYGGGFTQEYEVPASGSGVILDKTDDELLIVTNNHVIEDSKELSVTFIDGTTVNAAVKGADSAIDIAVIAIPLSEIPDETMSQIKVATLHDDEDLKVGQGVIAIGNSLGYGQTVTVGYISALDREIAADSSVYSNLIQVDAAINPGNSGGALLNMDGEVIGINVAKLSQTSIEGVGFSIPIYKAREVIDNLSSAKTKIEVDAAKQGRLGIYMNTVSEANAAALSIPAGVIIKGFSDEEIEGYDDQELQDSPAKEAGLLKNDIITKFDNQNIRSADELASMMKYYEKGSEVEVTVQRLEEGAYNEKVIKVTLGGKDDPATRVNGGKGNAQDKNKAQEKSAGNDNAGSSETEESQENGTGIEENPLYELFKQFLDQYR